MGVLRKLHRHEATAPGTGVARLGLRYGDCWRDTPSTARLLPTRGCHGNGESRRPGFRKPES